MASRALLIVLDSVGCGHAPDAISYGDNGSDTLGHILEECPNLAIPNLREAGLNAILQLSRNQPAAIASPAQGVAVLSPVSAGKDTTTGHWELAGVVLQKPFRTFEQFPEALVSAIERDANVRFIGNCAASGTEILTRLGAEHVRSGNPILYTSADSVLQIAAHESLIPTAALMEICACARVHCDAWEIGRVIARPFVSGAKPGTFERTGNRRDFSMIPPRTILNALVEKKIAVTAIGKIHDIFAGSGITRSYPTKSNTEGMERISELWQADDTSGLIFANLVDFDQSYGHRRDVPGYARALEDFDRWLGEFLPSVRPEDLVIITADHGNDPTWIGTDHTRERVPVWMPAGRGKSACPGLREGFSDVAATLADFFGVTDWRVGCSLIS